MLLSLSFIALCFSINATFVKTAAPSNIASLFHWPPGAKPEYPSIDVPGPKPRPQWIAAYLRVKKAGLIPLVPPSTSVDGRAVYPASYHGTICNPGYNRCNATVDVISTPPGLAAISFDDGPQPASLGLLEYLKLKQQNATHFLIGSRIISNPDTFRAIDQAGQHLAAHTFSHPMMTTLTDMQIVGEIGWTMQLIHDYSRAKLVASFFRPPYGDHDQRVQAIAKHVFGLKSILWLYDSSDWCLADSSPNASVCPPGNGPQNIINLKKTLNVFVNSAKKKGLIMLQHEQSTRAVAAFKYIYPIMKKLKWNTVAIPQALNLPGYQ